MELKDHVSLWRKNFFLMLLIGVLVSLVAVAALYSRPTQYRSSISFTIDLLNRPKSADYQYDDYYAIKSAELTGDTIISWFLTPAVLVDIFDQAQVSQPQSIFGGFGRFFSTEKFSAQVVLVSFSDPSPENVDRLSRAVVAVVESRAGQLNNVDGDKPTYQVTADDPFVVERPKPYWLVGSVGLIVGVLLGAAIIYLRHYLR